MTYGILWSMPVVETLLFGYVAVLCLGLGWLIGRRGMADLIAGYRSGDLPPEQEQAFTTEIGAMLSLVGCLFVLAAINFWTLQLSVVLWATAVVSVLLVLWSFWTYRHYEVHLWRIR